MVEPNNNCGSGFQTSFMPAPQGHHIHSPQMQAPQLVESSFHASQAVSIAHSSQQFAFMPQMIPLHAQSMDGYYHSEEGLQANTTMLNMELHSTGFYQPNEGSIIYPMPQVSYNFFNESVPADQGPYSQMTPTPNHPQHDAVEPLTPRGMVCHPNGLMEHAAYVYQNVDYVHAEAWQHAQHAERIKTTRESLDASTPPRARRWSKRRPQAQGMGNQTQAAASRGEPESAFGPATPTDSSGTLWEASDDGLPPGQTASSAAARALFSTRLSPRKEWTFEAPSTPQSFALPPPSAAFASGRREARKRDGPVRRGMSDQGRASLRPRPRPRAGSPPAGRPRGRTGYPIFVRIDQGFFPRGPRGARKRH